jgi:hypothetical protein
MKLSPYRLSGRAYTDGEGNSRQIKLPESSRSCGLKISSGLVHQLVPEPKSVEIDAPSFRASWQFSFRPRRVSLRLKRGIQRIKILLDTRFRGYDVGEGAFYSAQVSSMPPPED